MCACEGVHVRVWVCMCVHTFMYTLKSALKMYMYSNYSIIRNST